ncbi:hypothetical protein FLAG1_09681 [Fusarium langsethiae]|uniref:Uncharacterized protein n=1 Tax=Fusarium langsethiae TaxID=179993 RepID=A0A0M9EQE9_FUSLA|nr:hypothetical protein FLAG1_09681 [Fusarium langsethiae]GKU06820.1 unnamed protein product [Fusarium langsethiae]GKU22197.1 unnamed protein product [Fusarium langsethiae]
MSEHNNNIQDSVISQGSTADSIAETTAESQLESPILGYANAPPPYRDADEVRILGQANAPPPGQGASQPPILSHNQSRVIIHDWQCSSFSFVKPTTRQQYRIGCRTADARKERLERELYEVRRILRSFGVSEEEFQAALVEYTAIKHEILELELRHACSRRAWKFVREEEIERLLRFE